MKKNISKMETKVNTLEQLEKERGEVYGDPKKSHKAIGYAFRGVLQNAWHHIEVPEIPDWLTAHLLAVFKTVRGARPVYKADSYDDNHVYLGFSERFRSGK